MHRKEVKLPKIKCKNVFVHHKIKQIQAFKKLITENFISFDKIMKIWNPKNIIICFKLRQKDNPYETSKLGISNPKRYHEYPYHFTI